jgi:nitroreductase
MPQTRSLRSAMAAIAIALPEEQGKALSHAYDEGRAAERLLVGATMLGLGAGIAWILAAARGTVGELLHLPGQWRVRTVVAIGHPSASALRPKSAPGQARLPRDEVVFDERWPGG